MMMSNDKKNEQVLWQVLKMKSDVSTLFGHIPRRDGEYKNAEIQEISKRNA